LALISDSVFLEKELPAIYGPQNAQMCSEYEKGHYRPLLAAESYTCTRHELVLLFAEYAPKWFVHCFC
jgi:hypothetical protein